MPSVERTVLRYIVPFYLGGKNENNYAYAVQRLLGNGTWKSYVQGSNSKSVFEYLFKAINNDSENSIGSSWEYSNKNKLPKLIYSPEKENSSQTWRISNAGIYLFRTNIGLFWYELSAPKRLSDDFSASKLMNIQNRFKELNRTGQYFETILSQKSKDEFGKTTPFNSGQWINSLLSEISEDIHFFNGFVTKDGKECPDKALIFNYVLMSLQDDTSLKLNNIAYLLQNGYNEKYVASEASANQCIYPFENVCISASRNGCGIYANQMDINKDFFSSTMVSNITTEYFFLYILALYQSYSIMNFTRQSLCDYSANPSVYYNPSNDDDKLDKLVAEMNTFFMKSMFSAVSNIQHHNDFFNYLKDRLLINEEAENIRTGTESLVKLQRLYLQKEADNQREAEAQAETNRDKRINFALAIISIFSLFAAFNDIDELFTRIKSIEFSMLYENISYVSIWTIIEIIFFAVFLIISLACIILLVKGFVTQKKKHKK